MRFQSKINNIWLKIFKAFQNLSGHLLWEVFAYILFIESTLTTWSIIDNITEDIHVLIEDHEVNLSKILDRMLYGIAKEQ